MNCCYILYSPAYDKFYIGASSEGAEHRLIKHNNKTYGATFTAFTSDWILFLEIKCDSYAIAINIERHIKRMKSKKLIRNLVTYPELINKMISKYS